MRVKSLGSAGRGLQAHDNMTQQWNHAYHCWH